MSEDIKSKEVPTNTDIESIKKQLDAEIKDAQDKLVSEEVKKEIEAAESRAKEQARIDFEKEQIAKEQERKIKELEEQIKLKEKEAHDKLIALTEKVNNMTTSKAVYTAQDNPFNKPQHKIDLNNHEQYKELEERSRDLFLQERNRG